MGISARALDAKQIVNGAPSSELRPYKEKERPAAIFKKVHVISEEVDKGESFIIRLACVDAS